MPSRKYEQRLRATAAEETRRRILDTLYERLRAAPSQPVGIDDLARRAGVARSTVYKAFGSRAGVFDALAVELVRRAGYGRLVDAVRDPDARIVLRSALRTGVEMYAEHRDVQRALYSMATLDDDIAGGPMRRMEQERARGMRRLALGLDAQGALRPDVGVEEAASLLWLLTSFDGFDLLYTGHGLSTDQTARLLVATAERSLCR